MCSNLISNTFFYKIVNIHINCSHEKALLVTEMINCYKKILEPQVCGFEHKNIYIVKFKKKRSFFFFLHSSNLSILILKKNLIFNVLMIVKKKSEKVFFLVFNINLVIKPKV